MKSKLCGGCGEVKSVSEFYKASKAYACLLRTSTDNPIRTNTEKKPVDRFQPVG